MVKEKRTIKAKAKVNLKYDKDVIKIGEEFSIRKSDVKTVGQYAEILTKIEVGDPPKEPGKDDADGNTDDGEEE